MIEKFDNILLKVLIFLCAAEQAEYFVRFRLLRGLLYGFDAELLVNVRALSKKNRLKLPAWDVYIIVASLTPLYKEF